MAAQGDISYTAPYQAWPGTSAAPDCYELEFREGYEITRSGWLGYLSSADPSIELTGEATEAKTPCKLTQYQLRRIRQHYGVAKVTQFGDHKWLRAREIRWKPSYLYGDNWELIVMFTDRQYTVKEHFERIGLVAGSVGDTYLMNAKGDYAPRLPLSNEHLRAIFSDPNVLQIEQRSGACFHGGIAEHRTRQDKSLHSKRYTSSMRGIPLEDGLEEDGVQKAL